MSDRSRDLKPEELLKEIKKLDKMITILSILNKIENFNFILSGILISSSILIPNFIETLPLIENYSLENIRFFGYAMGTSSLLINFISYLIYLRE